MSQTETILRRLIEFAEKGATNADERGRVAIYADELTKALGTGERFDGRVSPHGDNNGQLVFYQSGFPHFIPNGSPRAELIVHGLAPADTEEE